MTANQTRVKMEGPVWMGSTLLHANAKPDLQEQIVQQVRYLLRIRYCYINAVHRCSEWAFKRVVVVFRSPKINKL